MYIIITHIVKYTYAEINVFEKKNQLSKIIKLFKKIINKNTYFIINKP